jgi:hypothetical protein
MILNELTNEDAIEAAREEGREEAREETWEEAWGEAREATRQEVFALIDKGLTGDQLKKAIQSERLRVVPKTTRTKSSKR